MRAKKKLIIKDLQYALKHKDAQYILTIVRFKRTKLGRSIMRDWEEREKLLTMPRLEIRADEAYLNGIKKELAINFYGRSLIPPMPHPLVAITGTTAE